MLYIYIYICIYTTSPIDTKDILDNHRYLMKGK